MAAPRYRGYGDLDATASRSGIGEAQPAVPRPVAPRRSPEERRRKADALRREAMRRRRFIVLVVTPVLLMLGSVYLHTVAGDVNETVSTTESRVVANEDRSNALRVRATELSGPERIQTLATEELGMEPATSEDFVVGRSGREDGSKVVSQGETD